MIWSQPIERGDTGLVGWPSQLEVLSLNGNQLTGTIPPELGSLTNLERLYLSDNQLTGPIPPELGRASPSCFNCGLTTTS